MCVRLPAKELNCKLQLPLRHAIFSCYTGRARPPSPHPAYSPRGAKLSNVGRSRDPACHHSGCCSSCYSCCCCCFSSSLVFGGCHVAQHCLCARKCFLCGTSRVSRVAGYFMCNPSLIRLHHPCRPYITCTHIHACLHTYTYILMLISPISCKKCRPRLAQRLSLL